MWWNPKEFIIMFKKRKGQKKNYLEAVDLAATMNLPFWFLCFIDSEAGLQQKISLA